MSMFKRKQVKRPFLFGKIQWPNLQHTKQTFSIFQHFEQNCNQLSLFQTVRQVSTGHMYAICVWRASTQRQICAVIWWYTLEKSRTRARCAGRDSIALATREHTCWPILTSANECISIFDMNDQTRSSFGLRTTYTVVAVLCFFISAWTGLMLLFVNVFYYIYTLTVRPTMNWFAPYYVHHPMNAFPRNFICYVTTFTSDWLIELYGAKI